MLQRKYKMRGLGILGRMNHAVLAVDAIKRIERHLTSHDIVENSEPRKREAQKYSVLKINFSVLV